MRRIVGVSFASVATDTIAFAGPPAVSVAYIATAQSSALTKVDLTNGTILGRADSDRRDDDGLVEIDSGAQGWSSAKRLALLIAVGIGLHNFAEGLAIGQSAASNEIALATLLVIGFGLHNATEGFGIVAPIAADAAPGDPPPTWGFLLLMGLIGGGPTVFGTATVSGRSS